MIRMTASTFLTDVLQRFSANDQESDICYKRNQIKNSDSTCNPPRVGLSEEGKLAWSHVLAEADDSPQAPSSHIIQRFTNVIAYHSTSPILGLI